MKDDCPYIRLREVFFECGRCGLGYTMETIDRHGKAAHKGRDHSVVFTVIAREAHNEP